MAPLLSIRLRWDLLLASRFLQVQQRLTKTPRQQKKQIETKWPELHHTQQIVSARLAPGAEIVMVVTCTFFRFVFFREPHRYSNLLRMQESPSITNLTGPDTSHVIHGNMFRTRTFVESLKETNKIETKQQKSKSKNNILDLFRRTPHCMVLSSSTNFIKDTSWLQQRSKALMNV